MVGLEFDAWNLDRDNIADGTQFITEASQQKPLLTISVPVGLGFRNPGPITVQGNGNGTRLTTNLSDTDFGLRVLPEKLISLIGGDVVIDGGTIKAPGGRIEIGSVLSGTTGISNYNGVENFTFEYKNISALGTIQLVRQSAVDASGSGAGDVFIQGQNLLLADGSQIESSTLAAGAGGTVTMNISDTIKIEGTSTKGRFITPSGISAFVYPNATGSGASLNVTAGRLVLKDGGTLSTATLGAGSGSNLTINAQEIEVIGSLSTGRRAGGIATSVAPRATGKAGNLVINTRRLRISNGGIVSTTSLGIGKPGDLLIKGAELVELSGSASEETPSTLSARSTGIADSGNITVETKKFEVLDGARTSVRNDGSGNAGTLQINASSIYLDDKGSIAASTASGKGGNIVLQAENLQLRRNSNLTTSADRAGEGGNISISTDTLIALNNSDIAANAVTGPGGNIQITTQGLFLSPDSNITASSQFGIDGVVNIQTLGFDIRNSLTPLENNFVTSEQVIAGSCLANRNAAQSSFVVTGSGGLPVNPYSEIQEWENLSTSTIDKAQIERFTRTDAKRSLTVAVSDENTTFPKKWKLGDPIVEAQGIVRLPNGRVLLGIESQKPASAPSLTCS